MSNDFVYWFLEEHNTTHHEGFDVAEDAWNHQQKKIIELESKLKAINEYQKIVYDQMQEHNLNYELIFNKLEDIEDLSK